MISFKELHFQLLSDPFYGFSPQDVGKQPSEVQPTATQDHAASEGARNSRHTNSHALVEKLYKNLAGVAQAQQFRSEFGRKFFKGDVHRELIYLWCSFRGLTAYRDNQPLDWNWRDFIKHWDADFAFKKDELREFLRRQALPLPAYLYFDEPDTTATINELPIVWAPDSDSAQSPTEKGRKAKTHAKYQHWQARLDELSQMPAHRGKTKEQLCTIIAKELIAEGGKASYITRKTKMPRKRGK